MQAMTDCAAGLGSRFNLIFDPETRRLYHHTFGPFPGEPLQLTAAIDLADGRRFCLPFRGDATCFEGLEYFPSLTRITYRGFQPAIGLELVLSVLAPFYPRDIKLSTAPFYLVDISVGKMADSAVKDVVNEGSLVFSVNGERLESERMEDGFQYRPAPDPARKGGGELPSEAIFRCHGLEGFEVEGEDTIWVPFDLSRSPRQNLSVVWSCWSEDSPLRIGDRETELKYKQFFNSEQHMLRWVRENREEIEEKCRFLDGICGEWSLGADTAHMSALALHTFLADTWWVAGEDGKDWFSACSGSERYHSAIDVEYNCALFYLNLWPELLDMLLAQWAGFEVSANDKHKKGSGKASFLCRDMGAGHVVGSQAYPHYMEVEENSNYLLLMAARTFFTGDISLSRRYLPLCRRLATFIINSDSDGDGFPDMATANTIDDAGPALQYSRPQTYLGVKAQAALWAMGDVEELIGEKDCKKFSERWKAFAAKGVKTLSENAWLKDHYSVCLSRTTDGMIDPHTGERLPEGSELKGWDDYSVYTTNGLLYLLITNMKMPRWNHSRFVRDIMKAEAATRTTYGNTHTGTTERNVWFSQNLWRDYTAAYLGVDFLHKIEEYKDYQQLPHTGGGPVLYRDRTGVGNPGLSPRGVTVFGAAMAAAGLRINRVEEEVYLAPVRRTLKVPIIALADWDAMRMPWVIAETRDGVTTVNISEDDLLKGLKVHVIGAEREEA